MKIKKLSNQQIIISIDRLTRFKDPETKYLRVFKEIILNNLIEPKFKKNDLDIMDYESIRDYATQIINESVSANNKSSYINNKLKEYEKSIFLMDSSTEKLLNNKINYEEIIKILPEHIPDNLKYLKFLSGNQTETGVFPIKKILLCEGITEEILLPEFAKLCNYDFAEHGIYIVSAGGKNQVVKYFYNYANSLKIPIFVLLDNDAKENLKQIQPKLRKSDKIHLVRSGEFEDLLPKSLIYKTLKYTTENISIPTTEEIEEFSSTVDFLTEFFRHRGLHEFKKSDFAMSVRDNISDLTDVSEEIMEIIKEINY